MIRRAASRVLVAGLLVALTAVAVAAEGQARDTDKSIELTDRAAGLIERGRLDEAVDLLDQALEADDDNWEAYYHQGRIAGMRQDYLMARHFLLEASERNPGHAHTHRLAWEAAYRVGDFENAWDQAIRASLAGIDMNPRFLEMFGRSDPPEDFELRINAPKIYVAALEIDELAARNQLPYDRNPATGGVGSISGRPDFAEGLNRANENAFNLKLVRDSVRSAVFRARYLGIVLDLQLADYVLGISVDALGEGVPVSMEGYLRLYDARSGEAVFFRSISLRDISSEAALYGEMERQVVELQEWMIERRRD